MCRDENNEDANLEVVQALSVALGTCSRVSEASLKQLAAGMQEKELLRRAFLRAFVKVLL